MTIYEHVCKTWPNHAQRIIEAAYECDRAGAEHTLTRTMTEPSPKLVLACLFVWSCTIEGYEYWKAIANGEACNV